MNTTDTITASVSTTRSIWKRVWPLIAVAGAISANAAWIVFLGYLVLKLFS
jgi:hypothetical protein